MKWLRNLWKAPVRRPVLARQRFRPGVEDLEDRLAPATLTVTSNADPTAPNGQTILRDAIQSIDNGANTGSFAGGAHTVGTYGINDTIVFNLSAGNRIIEVSPGSNNPLPFITNPVIINGWSAATGNANATGAAPLVEIDGSQMGAFNPSTQIGYNGLNISANGCTIEGLAIGGFLTNSNAQLGQENGTGIFIFSNSTTIGAQGSNNVVQGCYLGLTLTGQTDTNQADGITIQGGSFNVIGIGSTIDPTGQATGTAANVISENDEGGVKLGGYHNNASTVTGSYTTFNVIGGNLIGTDITGSTHMGNNNGVELFQAVDNTVENNTIAGNAADGIFISGDADFQAISGSGSATNNTISGNFIGLNHANETAIENFVDGIDLYNHADSNVIQNNNIVDAGQNAIAIDSSNNNLVTDNFIGITQDQQVASSPGNDGILLDMPLKDTPSGNTISGNTIARCNGFGIELQDANNNSVSGNFVGTDANGDTNTPSGFHFFNNGAGIQLDGSSASNTIGGIGVGNVVSNNGSNGSNAPGINLTGTIAVDPTGNFIWGNFIGTNPQGQSLPNDGDGIDVISAGQNLIGGTTTGQANIIAYNPGYGINISFNSTGGVGNLFNMVQGNLIGAVPNPSLRSLNTATTPAYTTFTGTDAAANTIAADNTLGVILDTTGANLGDNSYADNTGGVSRDPVLFNVPAGSNVSGNHVIKAVVANAPIATGGSTFLVLTNTDGTVVAKLAPFGTSWTDGMSVAYGDVNGDGVQDIIVGAGAGGGPQVVVYDSTTFQVMASFYAFDPKFTGGVNVACADLNGVGTEDIICAAGSGGGPQVTIFDGTRLNRQLSSGLLDVTAIKTSFYAFDPSFRGGVRVASDDVNGDGGWDLILAAGPGAGPQVLVIDGSKMTQLQANAEIAASAILRSFFAFDSHFTGGVSVAAGDTNHDNSADIITGAGPGGSSQVAIWDGVTGKMLDSFFAFGSGFSGGVSVGTADFKRDGHLSLLAAAQSGSNQVSIFDATSLTLANSFAANSQGNSIAGTRS